MNLKKKKILAAKTLGVGRNRIRLLKSRLDEIKEAITKQDIRDLKNDGAILIKEIGDMDKHTLEELRDATKSKAISQLKSSVKKKIEEIDWTIKEYRGSWDIVSKYQLQKLN